jgi:CheY-like chemotaxis protein
VDGESPECMAKIGTILVADDNADDVLLIKTAFERTGFDITLMSFGSGASAISYFQGVGAYADRSRYPIPQVVLLDLKMPGVSGFEVLEWLRQRPEWKHLPVIVVSNLYYGPDVKKAYDLGASSFLTKPMDFRESVAALRLVCDYWLGGLKSPLPAPFVPRPEA